MEIDDKEASRIHGIFSSDSDSDYNSREFDEEYNLLKPPPLDYNSIKDKIVVISRERVVNVWEKRLKNLEKNNEEGIRAAHVTLATKKKKKKLKVNAFDGFPKLKKGVEKDVKIEQPKKKLKKNAQNQAFNSLSSKNSCSHAGPSKAKEKKVANVNSPKIFYDIDTLKKVEEKISGLENVWHSGLSYTIIQEQLSLQRQRESSMYEFWMKSASIEGKLKETVKEEDKTVKNKGKTKKKSKQPVGKSPSTNVAKDVKDIKKDISIKKEKQTIKNCKGNGTQSSNLTLLDEGTVEYAWQQYNTFSSDVENDTIFTNEATTANTTVKTKKKCRWKMKSKQSVDKMVNLSPMNESHNSEDKSVGNMTKKAKSKTDFEEVLETLPDREKWNMQLLNKENTKKVTPKNKEKQIIKYSKEIGTQNMNLTFLNEETVKPVGYWQQFDGFSNDIESGPIFTNEMKEANTITKTKKKTIIEKKSEQLMDKLVNQSAMNQLHNSEDNSVKNKSTLIKDKAKEKTDFEKVLETSPDEETWNIQLLDKENTKKEIPKNKEMEIIKDSEENGTQNMNLMLLDEEIVKRVWYWQYFYGFSNDIESGPIFTNAMTEANTITKTKKKTIIEKKSEQLMDKLVNQSAMNQLHNSEDDSVKNITTLVKDVAEEKTDFEKVLETSPDEETWYIQLLDKENTKKEIPKNKEMEIIKDSEENGTQNMNLMLLDEEIVKRVWYWQYFYGFSNDIESGPIFTNEMTEANTITKTKKKTIIEKKSEQLMDKLVNQSAMNQLHNSEDDSVKNITTLVKDVAEEKTDFEKVLETSPDEETWYIQLLDKENTKKEIPKNKEMEIIKDSEENGTQNMNLMLLDEEIVKRVWYWQYFYGFSNDIESGPIFTKETTEANTTTETKKKTRSKKKSKQSVEKVVNQNPMNESHNNEDDSVENVTTQLEDEETGFEEVSEMSSHEEKWNMQLLDKENTKKLIPKNEQKQIVKNCKQNDTQDLNLMLLHQKKVKGILYSGNFVNEIQQFKGVQNDTEKDPTFTNETTKVNTIIKTKKKTRSKKKTKQSVNKLVNQSPMSKLHNSKPNLIDNVAKQDKNKYADSKETLKASYSEETCNPQFHKKILAPAWFLSPGDTKIQSVGKIQGEIGNRSTIKDTKQVDITSTIVGKPKTKKKKKSKQSTVATRFNKVGQNNERTNEDRVKLEKRHRENSTDSLQHQQTTQKSLDLNSAVQENVCIENKPINKDIETFDNTATLKNPQYVFDEDFKYFIQNILFENAVVPDLNGFTYEQLQRAYKAYQEKKNVSKQQNAVPYNVAMKNGTKENKNFWPCYENRSTNPNSCSWSTPVLTYPAKTNINSITKLSQERQATEAKLEVTNRISNVTHAMGFDAISTSSTDQYGNIYRVMYDGRNENSSDNVKKTMNDSSFTGDRKGLFRHLGSSNDHLKSNSNVMSTYNTSSTVAPYRHDMKNIDYRQSIVHDQNTKEVPMFSWKNENYYDRSSRYVENYVEKPHLGQNADGCMFEDRNNSSVSFGNGTSYFDASDETKSSELREYVIQFGEKRPVNSSATISKVNAATSRAYDNTPKDFHQSFESFTRIYNDAIGFDAISTSNVDQYRNIYRVMYDSRNKNSSDDVKKRMNDRTFTEDSNKGLLVHLGSSNHDLESNPNVSRYGTSSSVARYRHDVKNTDYCDSIVSHRSTKKVPISRENEHYFDHSSRFVENYAEKQHLFEDRNRPSASFGNRTSYLDASNSLAYRDNEMDELIFVLLHIFCIAIVAVLVASTIMNLVSILYNNIFFVGLIIFICMKFKSQ